MQINHSESTPWSPARTVRGGKIVFKHVLDGEENKLTNYSVVIADTDVTFKSPRHRHNFDQLRITLEGSTNYGPRHNIEVGDVTYFPEGTHYGPQDQELVGKSSLAMVIQFGGASGQGYMSLRQLFEGQKELEKSGRFEGGIYKREPTPDNPRVNQDAYEAIWEHVNGRELHYPKPRMTEPVHFRAAHYPWQPVEGQPGAFTKELGSFSERGIRIACVKLDAGAAFALPDADQEQIVFFTRGSGSVSGGQDWHKHSTAYLARGEAPTLRASEDTEAVVLGLPRF